MTSRRKIVLDNTVLAGLGASGGQIETVEGVTPLEPPSKKKKDKDLTTIVSRIATLETTLAKLQMKLAADEAEREEQLDCPKSDLENFKARFDDYVRNAEIACSSQ